MKKRMQLFSAGTAFRFTRMLMCADRDVLGFGQSVAGLHEDVRPKFPSVELY